MGIIELIVVGISLSMDAFAVSVTNGISVKQRRLTGALACGVVFGAFQGAMPVIGYALGIQFAQLIKSVDHYIALFLLSFIGIKMIIEAKNSDGESKIENLTFSLLLVQGFATSVDALTVGVSMAALMVNIVLAASLICLVTGVFSMSGFIIGRRFGSRLNSKAEITGGVILILLSIKIFLEHILF